MNRVRSLRNAIVRIQKGTFYRHHPAAQVAHSNPPLFSDLDFSLSPDLQLGSDAAQWCVVGPSLSGKTTFLQVLRGQHLCVPAHARSYPLLATDDVPRRLKTVNKAVQYVGFDNSGGGGGLGPATSAYLAARYESKRENTDFSLRDYLLGNTQLNPYSLPGDEDDGAIDQALFDRVVDDLRLDSLLDLPVAFLSNGQGRRARIARALLTRPKVLLLDEPFMGLDPPSVASLSPLLLETAFKSGSKLVMSARPQDPLPYWITHLVYLKNNCQVGALGRKEEVLKFLQDYIKDVQLRARTEDKEMPIQGLQEVGRLLRKDGTVALSPQRDINSRGVSVPVSKEVEAPRALGEPLVEMEGCQVQYGKKVALGNWEEERDGERKKGLFWTVRRGERWGVFGPNGSGKTTIVSLLCSDHPQTYSEPIKLFGRSRLPEPGSRQLPLTFWDIQARIGHSSPEVHQHIPRSLTVRQVIENAWSDTFLMKPKLSKEAEGKVDTCLRWFAPELHPSYDQGRTTVQSDLSWASNYIMGELSFSAQRVLLFLRAVIKNSDIVVLDEAFSGMDEKVRDKCMLFLKYGSTKTYNAEGKVVDSNHVSLVTGLSNQQALICISHIKEEVPDAVREWVCLPEANSGSPARFGRLDGPLDGTRWSDIWNLNQAPQTNN